jgi:signal transduction histidine kinase
MLRLKNEQALEQERLRIAHDIHDDLGARVTEISLLSAMSQSNPAFPEKARGEFERISHMSRELVSALYQTVWAVNPENDNLDALGNYLCQMVNQMCERVKLRCRFEMAELPREIPISSQTRHNITMGVKEAVHNAIKHAKASEICIHLTYKENLLTISVEDNGCGFQPVDRAAGHGLANMKKRMVNVGGSCAIDSRPGQGTTVYFRLLLKSPLKFT